MRSIGSIWQATLSGMRGPQVDSLSPFFMGRGLGEGQTLTPAIVAAPHPALSPKDGEREHAKGFARAVSTRIREAWGSHVQGVRQVRRQPARHHQHGVEPPLVLAVGGMSADPELGGAGNAAGLPGCQGGLRLAPRQAPLHLDEGETRTPHRDKVDALADGVVSAGRGYGSPWPSAARPPSTPTAGRADSGRGGRDWRGRCACCSVRAKQSSVEIAL